MDILDKTTSALNEAGLQLQRLHNIWLTSRISREGGNLTKCRWNLDSAEVELSEDIDILDGTLKGDEKFSKKVEELNEKISKKNFSLPSDKQDIYNLLIKKEKLLRKIQNQIGKGAKYKDWDEDEMD